ncbi:phosphotransferase [Microlunatus sp. GCM10028923]|uniref:phosphotransferase n=1 Tax=Microlunatus sp. GCM10028923 TaxID=3273400 RepID=UPI0036122F69
MSVHPLTPARRAAALAALRGLAEGSPVAIVAEQHLGHDWAPVTRLTLDRELPGIGDSVVVKTRRVDGSGHGGPAYLRREASGLGYAGFSGVAARLLYVDPTADLTIQSDLGDWPTLQDLLLGSDAAAARAAMIEFGTALGRLHGGTLGLGPDDQPADGPESAGLTYRYGIDRWYELERTCADLELPSARPARPDVEALLRRNREPSRADVLVHADLNPTNVVITDAGVRLIDFECSRFDRPGIDACFLLYPFPHHSNPWGVLPAEVITAADAAYREAWQDYSRGVLLDDAVLTDGAAIVLIGRTLRLARLADPDQSAQDRRRRRGQLRQQIEVFLRLAEPTGHLTGLAAWFGDLAEAMVRRWPEAAGPWPLYPAFY